MEDFKKEADREYDNGYGCEEVNRSLVIVGKDWWLERANYDGSEWWKYKKLPDKPSGALRSSDIWDDWHFRKESIYAYRK